MNCLCNLVVIHNFHTVGLVKCVHLASSVVVQVQRLVHCDLDVLFCSPTT